MASPRRLTPSSPVRRNRLPPPLLPPTFGEVVDALHEVVVDGLRHDAVVLVVRVGHDKLPHPLRLCQQLARGALGDKAEVARQLAPGTQAGASCVSRRARRHASVAAVGAAAQLPPPSPCLKFQVHALEVDLNQGQEAGKDVLLAVDNVVDAHGDHLAGVLRHTHRGRAGGKAVCRA